MRPRALAGAGKKTLDPSQLGPLELDTSGTQLSRERPHPPPPSPRPGPAASVVKRSTATESGCSGDVHGLEEEEEGGGVGGSEAKSPLKDTVASPPPINRQAISVRAGDKM